MTSTGYVANSHRARAQVSPSSSGLKALDHALAEVLLSDVPSPVVNVTSAGVDTASAIPSATASQDVSASEVSDVQSSVSTISVISSSEVTAVSSSVASGSTPSATGASSANASQIISSAAVQPTLVATASSTDAVLTVPKNAAVSSSAASVASSPAASEPPSPAPSVSSDASTEKRATFETHPAATIMTPASSSSSVAPSVNTSTSVPETSTTEVPATTQASPTSSIAISTQREQTTAAATPASSSTINQTQASADTSTAEPQPASQATSPQSTNSSNPSGNQVQSSPSNASLGDFQPSETAVSSPNGATNHGASFIGISTSSSSVHVDSTLSTPEAVTLTFGSITFTTTPAFITSFSVSSGKDGSPPQTFTSIFANPTGFAHPSNLSSGSFGDNKGAVAGVFIAVVLVVLSLALGIFYCRRRRQRLARGISNTAFRRFSGPQDMLYRPTTYQAVGNRGLASLTDRYDPHRHLMAPSITSGPSNGNDDTTRMERSVSRALHNSKKMQQTGALGLTGVLANLPGLEDYHGPFSDYHRYISTGDTRLSTPPGEPVGIAVTGDFEKQPEPEREKEPVTERRPPSPAPSSPSIYPPSLPAVPEKNEDDYLFYQQETQRRPESQLPTPPPRAIVNDSDPQNPFSSPLDPVYDATLRQTISQPSRIVTNQPYLPLTPPDSSAGHSPTTPQFSGSGEPTKPLNVTRYSNGFLGRSVSMRAETLSRPARNPLRLSASGSLLQNKEFP